MSYRSTQIAIACAVVLTAALAVLTPHDLLVLPFLAAAPAVVLAARLGRPLGTEIAIAACIGAAAAALSLGALLIVSLPVEISSSGLAVGAIAGVLVAATAGQILLVSRRGPEPRRSPQASRASSHPGLAAALLVIGVLLGIGALAISRDSDWHHDEGVVTAEIAAEGPAGGAASDPEVQVTNASESRQVFFLRFEADSRGTVERRLVLDSLESRTAEVPAGLQEERGLVTVTLLAGGAVIGKIVL